MTRIIPPQPTAAQYAADPALTGTFASLLRAGAAPTLQAAVGNYWSYPAAHAATAAIQSLLTYHPVYVPRNMSVNKIGAEVTVGAVGSTVRLGIYESADLAPAALLLDAGTIDGNSATAQEITIAQALVGGRIYWLAAVAQGGTPTLRTFATTGTTNSWSGEQTSLANALGTGAVRLAGAQSGITGALPASATNGGPTGSGIIVALRRSA